MDVERGRKETLILAGLCIAIATVLMIRAWLVTVHFPGWIYPGALLLTLALSVLTMARRSWARRVLVVLAALASLAILAGSLQGFVYSPGVAVVLVFVAVLAAAIAWRLQTSRYVNAYFAGEPARTT